MNYKQPKFVLKSKSFDDFRKAMDDASKTKTIDASKNKDASGSDRSIKNIIMESVSANIDKLIAEGKTDAEIQNIIAIKA